MPLCDHPHHEKGEAMISREQLQSIEWAIKDEDGGSWCPACASPADIGHKCDCWLARALAASPAAVKAQCYQQTASTYVHHVTVSACQCGALEGRTEPVGSNVPLAASPAAPPERGTLERIMWLAQRGQLEQARAEFNVAVTHNFGPPAPPVAGAPPALVALVQRWQIAHEKNYGSDSHFATARESWGDEIREATRALLAWSPAPAPVAVVGVDWASGPDRSVALHAPVAPPGDDEYRPNCDNGECRDHYGDELAWCKKCRASLAPAPVTPPTDGSVMVRVDPVYVEQMRGDGLAGPFSRITLDERDGVPTLLLTTEPKPTPDTAEWWRAVAQELGVEIHKLKLAAQSVPSDLVRISQPGHSVARVSQPGQSPAPVAPPAEARTCHGCGYSLVRCYDCKRGGAVACCPDCDHSERSTEPAPPAVAGGDAPPEIQVDDVLVSKSGNRWRVQAVSGSHLLLHNVPEEAPRARGTVAHHEALPEWAAAIERNGGVIWRRRQEGQ